MLTRRHLLWSSLGLGLLTTGQAHARGNAQGLAAPISFSKWQDEDPYYVFFPGDEIETSLSSAPELNRKQLVGPDGRINLPYVGQFMAAYRTIDELQTTLSAAYATVLRRPDVAVLRGNTAPMRVLVGGEVKTPGWVDMGGVDLDALSATLAAGGFTTAAKPQLSLLIRRSQDGRAMRRIVDLKAILDNSDDQMVALRRFDIVYVPRSKIAEADLFMDQWVNSLIPGGIMNYFTYSVLN